MTTFDSDPPVSDGFRTCGACGRHWTSLGEFLDDGGLLLIGVQVAGHRPESNLMVFEHRCGTSVSVLTQRLRALDPDGTAGGAEPDRYGSEECRGLCRQLDEWSACDRPCINARDRRLLQLIIARKSARRA